MLIRYGYEITVTCEHPTAMVCLLSVSEDRKTDIRVAEKVFTTPIIATTTYVDSFGNRCRRLVAPSGDLTIWGDATIEDDGKIDPADFAAVEVPVAELPDSCLLCLMGSRYCETDKLSQVAWDLFGKIPPAGGTCRRFAISCIGTSSLTICRRDQPERRLKPSMNVSECVETSPISRSRFAAASTFRLATSMAISATLACPSWTRWISARRVVVDIRSSQQHPTDREDRRRSRPGRGRYPAHQLVRAACPQVFSGLDIRGLRSADDRAQARLKSPLRATYRHETIWAWSLRIFGRRSPASKWPRMTQKPYPMHVSFGADASPGLFISLSFDVRSG